MMPITTITNKMTWLLRRSHVNLLATAALVLPCLFNTINNIGLFSNKSAAVNVSLQQQQQRVVTVLSGNEAAICVIVSNEEYYIDEWLDYHLGIGFHHIFVYDNSNDLTDTNNDHDDSTNKNNNASATSSWLARRPRLHDKVTIIPYPGQNKQGSAYQHCARHYLLPNPIYRWVGFFDVDEYLVLKHSQYNNNNNDTNNNMLSAFLTKYCPNGSLSFNWQIHSWNNRKQYNPQPVTLRFRGKYNIDQHVKSISNIQHVNWDIIPHPHYTFLKQGYNHYDTSHNVIDEPYWQNLNYPSDVALLFHHHTKSHKEYIGKRSRGRATMEGEALRKSREELLGQARRRVGFHNSTGIDSLAWNTLKSIHAKYAFYDSSNNLHFNMSKAANQNNNATTTQTTSHAICTLVKDDEAYIDEWIDYHLSLGYTKIYMLDTTSEYWFEQWGMERSSTSSSSALVKVIHLPGNKTDVRFKANAYRECMEMYLSHHHDSLTFLDVNDFMVLGNESLIDSLDNYLQSSPDCAYSIPRRFFGNAGQAVYDPLPVTKRFMYRIEEDDNNRRLLPSQSVLVIKTNSSLSTMPTEENIFKYLTTNQWKSSACPGNNINDGTTTLNPDIYIHHYLRSTKECKKEREDGKYNLNTMEQLCVMEGTVYDSFVWDELQRLLPGYVNFNDLL